MSTSPDVPSPSRRQPARRAALRGLLRDAELDAVLVTDLVNIRYLTGFTGSNAALLVAADGEANSVFCTDFRYAEQARAEVPDLVTVIDRASDLALVARDTAGQRRLGFESHVVTVARHAELAGAAGRTALIGTAGLIERLRAVKDADEIAALRAACAIGDAALADLIDAGGIRAGRTEREVALDLDERMRRLGSQDVSFPTILAAGENSAIPHHQPVGRELAVGDLVKIDFGAVVDGYHSDMTRTFVLGASAAWQVDLHALVLAAQCAGRDAIAPGVGLRDVDVAARGPIVTAGFGAQFGHGLGHGVGLQVHEAPWFPSVAPAGGDQNPGNAPAGAAAVGDAGPGEPAPAGDAEPGAPAGIIAADMTVTVEPGVYLPGRGGVRIEDCGVVGPDGYQPLTHSPRELVVL
jgi:Xaa-Pro aminopeptidase